MSISVIIPVYNALNFVEEAVLSCLNCPQVAEIILVEDGSRDDSLQECLRLQKTHNRVKVETHPNNENRGAGASRNLGLANATGDFIAFLDASTGLTDQKLTYKARK